jgi:ABC-type antimicrobial peptide transport system permease subunit
VVRSTIDPSNLAASLRSAVWAIDKDLPVYDVATMEERLWRSGEARTAQTLLLASFALLAMSLTAVGIYGVASEAVQQRTGEIGLRMALGARGHEVRRMVMKRSFALALSGIAVGSAGSLVLVRYLASLLYGIEPTDKGTFVSVGFVLLLVTLLAGYVPARRASRIDPIVALRCE